MDAPDQFLYTVPMTSRYWLFVALVLTLTCLIGYATYRTARLLRVWTPDRNLLLLPGENLVRLVLIVLCIGLGYLSGLDAERLGWQMPRPGLQVLFAVPVGTALAFFFYAATRHIVERTGERFYSSVVLYAIIPRSRREIPLALLALGPIALLEELLFRSLLIGGLSPLVPAWLLVLGLGVLFGLLHSPQGSWGIAGAAGAGILFGALFLWQQSLLAPVVAHYVANAVQMGLALRSKSHLPNSHP